MGLKMTFHTDALAFYELIDICALYVKFAFDNETVAYDCLRKHYVKRRSCAAVV